MCKTTDLLHCHLMTCIAWRYIDMKEKVFQTIFTAFTIYRPDSPELEIYVQFKPVAQLLPSQIELQICLSPFK